MLLLFQFIHNLLTKNYLEKAYHVMQLHPSHCVIIAEKASQKVQTNHLHEIHQMIHDTTMCKNVLKHLANA
jgi:hypothetical protein